MNYDENIKALANKFVDEELKNRPMSLQLGVIETEIMDYLGMDCIKGDYFTLDDINKEKVDNVRSAVLTNPNVIQKEIHLEEEQEEDFFMDYRWVMHMDMPSEQVQDYVRKWNDGLLNDPDLDLDPFDPGKEELK